jgi:hypothetical protein
MTNEDSIQDPMRAALWTYRHRRDGYVSSGNYRPTEASCEIIDEFGNPKRIGKCRRAIYYRLTGADSGEKTDNTQLIFATGNAMEDYFCDMWEEAGVLITQGYRFRGETTAPDGTKITISGEMDGLLRNFTQEDAHAPVDGGRITGISDTKATIMEFKTARGMSIEATMPNLVRYPSAEMRLYPDGHPKLAYVMQVACYLHMKGVVEAEFDVTIDEGQICYAGLKPMVFQVFKVRLDADGNILVFDKFGNEILPSQAYLMGKHDDPNLTVNPRQNFNVAGILQSYADVTNALAAGVIPERDFQLRWSQDRINEMRANGFAYTGSGNLVNHVKNWEKDELATVGDFECGYCDFRDTCYPQLSLTEIVEAGAMTEEQALERLYDANMLRRPGSEQEELDAFFELPDF